MSEQIIKFLANPLATGCALIVVCAIWEAIPLALKWFRPASRARYSSFNPFEHKFLSAYTETQATGKVSDLASRYKTRRAGR